MAGVGFSLRKLDSGDSYIAIARVYGTAAVISSGPWLITIIALLVTGTMANSWVPRPEMVQRFQVSVTWLFASSLLLAGPMQLLLTRFVADRIYENRSDMVLPNLFGALGITSTVAALLGILVSQLFAGESPAYRLLFGATFVVLCDIWLVVSILNGIKEHGQVLTSFLLGYAVTFCGILLLARFGEVGLLLGFLTGQFVLLFHALSVVARKQPGGRAVAWHFLKRKRVYTDLLLIGFLYNAAIWVDKVIFWFNPDTSVQVVGPLRMSEVYEVPIFMAYLAIVPGMAVILMRIETDYAQKHAAFYDGIVRGATLEKLESMQTQMVAACRKGIYDVWKVQGLTVVLCFVFAKNIWQFFGISELHAPLFYVDVLGVSMQVLLLAVISILFYLDQRRVIIFLTFFFLITNAAGTIASQRLGIAFYGFGFTGAVTLTCLIGFFMLRNTFLHLIRDTFMQRGLGG